MQTKILNWKLFLEQVGETPISNLPFYNEDMTLSMPEKLFFIDKVDYDILVDFGGADGEILKAVIMNKPNKNYILYDIEISQINKAKQNLKEFNNVLITDNWNDVEKEVAKYNNPAINLSSVIHEVYSYSHPKVVKDFWENKIFGGLFNTIIIRDMIPSISIEKISDFKKEIELIRRKADKYHLLSFEKIWGEIDSSYRTFIHFLLKYRYKENWEREVKENYMPITIETLRKKIPSNFIISYKENYIFDFLNKEVMKDFGFQLKSPTHTKMIIKKK